jgi:hypothetical protein
LFAGEVTVAASVTMSTIHDRMPSVSFPARRSRTRCKGSEGGGGVHAGAAELVRQFNVALFERII